MSSLATAYICEGGVIEDLCDLFRRTLKTEPVKMKVMEFLRESATSPTPLNYRVLGITGLSDLLNAEYAKEGDPFTLFRESLKKLNRDTTLLVQVKELGWSPTRRDQISIDGKTFHVSDIDMETTVRIQNEHLPRGRARGRFVIAKI